MEKKVFYAVLVSTLLLCMMLSTGTQKGKAESTAVVNVNPEISHATVGQAVLINLSIANVIDLFGFQLKLGYDTVILDLVEVIIHPFVKPPIYVFANDTHEDEGWYSLAISSLASPPGVDGSGPLVTLTFKVTGVGNCTLNLYDTVLANSKAEEIPHFVEDGHFEFSRPLHHDIAAFVDAPEHLMPEDSVLLNATVLNMGLNNETGVELHLLVNGSIVNSTVIDFLQVSSSYTLSYVWTTTTVEATYNVTAYALPVPDEPFTLNNMESARVLVSYVTGVQLHTHIMADGSVDPLDAPIWIVDNVTYTFTGNINGSIVVGRDNIVVDGAGYLVQGTGSGRGIDLSGRSNVTIKNMKIEAFGDGVYLYGSSNNRISGNDVTNNGYGIRLSYSSNNSISGNNITANIHWGISLWESSNFNSISGNDVTNNGGGIALSYSSNFNSISGNSIANNWDGVLLQYSSNNILSSNEITGSHVCLWTDTSSNNLLLGNNITNNDVGVLLVGSNNVLSGNNIANNRDGIAVYESSDKIYHNNFINNGQHVMLAIGGIWDNGYPSGGNYWSDHVCTGNPSDGSQSYIIDENNVDHYPFQDPNGWVIPSDINGDGIVSINDVVIAALAFGSYPGDPNWNPQTDLNNDGVINIIDLVIIGVNFGKRLPL